jgi:hypothetical protein
MKTYLFRWYVISGVIAAVVAFHVASAQAEGRNCGMIGCN